MSVKNALYRFYGNQIKKAAEEREIVRLPCPWRPTPIEALAGGNCTMCGYPTRQHKEDSGNARRK